MQKERDPLNLGSLPLVAPDSDGWPVIESALAQHRRRQRLTRYAGGALAAAAVLMLAIGLYTQQPAPALGPVIESAPSTAAAAGETQTLDSIIALSQQLENQLRSYRSEVGGMPTDSLVYQVELEDMIAQVDEELSMSPDSLDLWGQRVNLLLDLSQLYQNQLRRDYRRMASL